MSKKSKLDIEIQKKIRSLSTREEKIYADVEPKSTDAIKSDFALECINVMSEIVSDVKNASIDELEQKLKRIRELKKYISKANIGKREQKVLLDNADKIISAIKKDLLGKNNILKKASAALSGLAERLTDEGTMQRMFGDDAAGDVLVAVGKGVSGAAKFTKEKVAGAINKRRENKAALKQDLLSIADRSKKAPKSSPNTPGKGNMPQGMGNPPDNQDLIKRDGSISFTGSLDLGSNKLVNLSEPSDLTDAANMGYVNNYVGERISILESGINNSAKIIKSTSTDVKKILGLMKDRIDAEEKSRLEAIEAQRESNSVGEGSGGKGLLRTIKEEGKGMLSSIMGLFSSNFFSIMMSVAPMLIAALTAVAPLMFAALGLTAVWALLKSSKLDEVLDMYANSDYGKNPDKAIKKDILGETPKGIGLEERTAWGTQTKAELMELFTGDEELAATNDEYGIKEAEVNRGSAAARILDRATQNLPENATSAERMAAWDKITRAPINEQGNYNSFWQNNFASKELHIGATLMARKAQREKMKKEGKRESADLTEEEYRVEQSFAANENRKIFEDAKMALVRQKEGLLNDGKSGDSDEVKKIDFLIAEKEDQIKTLDTLVRDFQDPSKNLNESSETLRKIVGEFIDKLMSGDTLGAYDTKYKTKQFSLDSAPSSFATIKDRNALQLTERMKKEGLGAGMSSTQGNTDPSKQQVFVPDNSASFEEKAKYLMSTLMERYDLTPSQAAAIVGNLAHESGGLQAGIQEKNPLSGQGGIGLAQWTGPRRKAFLDFAGSNYTDFGTNVQFLLHELDTEYKGSIKKLKTEVADIKQQTINFEGSFERAHKNYKHYGSRTNYAESALAAIGVSPGSSAANMSSLSAGWSAAGQNIAAGVIQANTSQVVTQSKTSQQTETSDKPQQRVVSPPRNQQSLS